MGPFISELYNSCNEFEVDQMNQLSAYEYKIYYKSTMKQRLDAFEELIIFNNIFRYEERP